jgi:hypothetical protein
MPLTDAGSLYHFPRWKRPQFRPCTRIAAALMIAPAGPSRKRSWKIGEPRRRLRRSDDPARAPEQVAERAGLTRIVDEAAVHRTADPEVAGTNLLGPRTGGRQKGAGCQGQEELHLRTPPRRLRRFPCFLGLASGGAFCVSPRFVARQPLAENPVSPFELVPMAFEELAVTDPLLLQACPKEELPPSGSIVTF